MNKKLLMLPISVIAFLVLLLVPLIPATVVLICPGGGFVCPQGIPIGARPLPSGGYTFSFYESVTFAFFKFGGTVNSFGTPLYTTVSIFNLIPLGVAFFIVFPLALVAAAGFRAAFRKGGNQERRVGSKVPFQEAARTSNTRLRYAFVLIGLALAASGFYIYMNPLIPTGTSQYAIGNHAYQTEIYSTSPILQILGLTCAVIGIAFILYALAFLKTKPEHQLKEQTSAQEEARPIIRLLKVRLV
jgi:multisubunit Na+/H+ antiporter MnhC subunit